MSLYLAHILWKSKQFDLDGLECNTCRRTERNIKEIEEADQLEGI
jgi:hypothetical protein